MKKKRKILKDNMRKKWKFQKKERKKTWQIVTSSLKEIKVLWRDEEEGSTINTEVVVET